MKNSEKSRRLFITPPKLTYTSIVEKAFSEDCHLYGEYIPPADPRQPAFCASKMIEELSEFREDVQSTQSINRAKVLGEIVDIFACTKYTRKVLHLPPAEPARMLVAPEIKWKELLAQPSISPAGIQQLLGPTESFVRQLMLRPDIDLTCEEVEYATGEKLAYHHGIVIYAQSVPASNKGLCGDFQSHRKWHEYPANFANPDTQFTRKTFAKVLKAVTPQG